MDGQLTILHNSFQGSRQVMKRMTRPQSSRIEGETSSLSSAPALPSAKTVIKSALSTADGV